MRKLTCIVVLLVCGCASPGAPYISPGVVTPALSQVDVSAYNAEIRRQGLRHHCPDGMCDTLPELVVGYAPMYPEGALYAGVSGEATIVFVVDERGVPTNLQVESSTAPEFSSAAIAALEKWRFRPSSLDGEPIRVSSRQQFPFVAL